MDEMDDLLSVPAAAQRAGVARNTMLLAAKQAKIKAKRLGRSWFVFSSDIDRWKRDVYMPSRSPSKKQKES